MIDIVNIRQNSQMTYQNASFRVISITVALSRDFSMFETTLTASR